MRTTAQYSAAAAAAAAAAVLTAAPATAAETRCAILSEGHVDVFGLAYEEGELELHVHDGENDVEYAPHEVLLQVADEAQTTVPADYGFIGAPGSKVWILPDTDVEGLLFAGWGAEEIAAGDFVDDTVTFTVHDAEGRGDVALYTVDDFGGADVLFDSDEGAGSWDATAGSHGHMNWAFTKAGLYRFTVEAEGVDAATGEAVSTGEVDYWFWVEA
ncbi:choice-of-anchor M domain-containing protein [Glycomyces sp. TRM65418]|uniref:choice-of-anchor M domain-containing protein n=1 Tax=Glycomyces sp. TRM65418 TaxID=2867006 RepID=UPI001CE6FEA9|nr:choice-of-anchor M domain-containing protein [Glycomyces sp. TRM65418]MCC3763112.1 choice-of-anchor M domain-containing protein [Glycomyces sp. TRM65418]QZD57120.1 choice-of-anchor M domain-containing protein [Glycomyces sp. TRM65418]